MKAVQETSFCNAEKQIVPCESIAKKVSYEWSHNSSKKKELPDTIPSKKNYAFAFVHQHGRRYVN